MTRDTAIETRDTGRMGFAPGTRRAALLAAVFGAGLVVGAAAQGIAGGTAPVDPAATSPDGRPPAPAAATRAQAGTPMAAATVPAGARDESPPESRPAAAAPDAATAERSAAATVPAAPVRLAAIDGRLVQLRNEIERLQRRVAALEQRDPAAANVTSAAPVADLDEPPPLPVDTPEDRYFALLSVGVEAERADEILDRQSRQALARLELRDRATRQGWIDSEQFRDAAAAQRRDAVDLRDELGDSSYDLYLYNTGANNRVQISSVMQGSAAHDYGLQPGDVIESYADRRVFDGRALRGATAGGVRGETVSVRIRRGDQVMETWLPRGPIGIALEPARVTPLP